MEKPIIEVKNIGKKYAIAHMRGGYVSLRDVIANVVRRPFSFLKHKTRQAVGLEKKEEFWALRGVSFTVKRGEVIGVIGSNGAGKSTLLKILSQITPPTEGEIVLRGRVGSLLEVGTGFHPELTGRDNIFLNGAILGMKKKEIAKKFDEIVAFAGIGKFLDTPVKRYSSGMYVRLAFSVAAHMDPEILVVDEVLAVGDAEFQKKCLGKMDELTKSEGRTIIFVSHNMSAIQQLCKKAILLKNGQISTYGETDEVIRQYLSRGKNEAVILTKSRENLDAQIKKITFFDGQMESSDIPIHKDVVIEIEFEVLNSLRGATICMTFSTNGNLLLNSYESDSSGNLADYAKGKYMTKVTIPAFTFNIGNYDVDISIQHPGVDYMDRIQNISFRIIDGENPKTAILKDNISGNMGSILRYDTAVIK